MNSRRCLTRHLTTLGLVAAVAILVAACGGAKKPPVSHSGRTSDSSAIKDAYRYSACMRTHGVTKFEDPHVSTSGNSVSIGFHVDPAITGSPAFKSAQRACAHILPNASNGPSPAQVHARTQAILAFARCMRQHGFPNFPDPNSQGQLPLSLITKAGIDLQQPAVKPAAYACAPVTHGLLTRANINQALANPNGSGSQAGSGG